MSHASESRQGTPYDTLEIERQRFRFQIIYAAQYRGSYPRAPNLPKRPCSSYTNSNSIPFSKKRANRSNYKECDNSNKRRNSTKEPNKENRPSS